MKAVIETGGQQFTVSPGDVVMVDLMPAKVGEDVAFDKVLLATVEGRTLVGTPSVEGAVVKARIISEIKGPKVRAVSFRRRKDSQTVKGHRQRYHRVRITAVEGVGAGCSEQKKE